VGREYPEARLVFAQPEFGAMLFGAVTENLDESLRPVREG
jgi:hypothetical protein